MSITSSNGSLYFSINDDKESIYDDYEENFNTIQYRIFDHIGTISQIRPNKTIGKLHTLIELLRDRSSIRSINTQMNKINNDNVVLKQIFEDIRKMYK